MRKDHALWPPHFHRCLLVGLNDGHVICAIIEEPASSCCDAMTMADDGRIASPRISRLIGQHLTKSRYVAGLQCLRRLWLQVHEPLPYEEPAPGSPMDIGQEIGRKAHLLFPGGALIDEEPWEHKEAVARTNALMIDAGVPAIFEAAFEFDGIRIRVDVLERLAQGNWGLREVKSSTSPKDYYFDDIALQAYVLKGASVVSLQSRLSM